MLVNTLDGFRSSKLIQPTTENTASQGFHVAFLTACLYSSTYRGEWLEVIQRCVMYARNSRTCKKRMHLYRYIVLLST